MKKAVFLLLAVWGSCLLFSFIPQQAATDGKIGDVRYSVLSPQQFVRLHGNGWVLMDGRNVNGSELFRTTRRASIPDGRGVFVRGMNENRNTAEGDQDGNREVGKFQGDEFKAHAHVYSDAYFAEVDCGNQSLIGNKGDHDNDNGRCASNQTTQLTGGNETRPRNIALYVYVKIN